MGGSKVIDGSNGKQFITCEAHLNPPCLEFSIRVIKGWALSEYRGQLDFDDDHATITQRYHFGLQLKHREQEVPLDELPEALRPYEFRGSGADSARKLDDKSIEWLISKMEPDNQSELMLCRKE